MAEIQIREIGIPVRAVNKGQLFAGRYKGGEPCLYATMGQQAANLFVLQINPETGELRQFWADVPDSTYTTAVYQSRDGRIYIGAAHSGVLYCFDPDLDDLLNLGEINGRDAIFPCRIDEDSQGVIWVSSFGTADLTSYNPDTKEFTRYGRLDEADMYAYCYVNTDDTIASMIKQTRLHVVVLDPKTGEKKTAGPVVTRGKGSLGLHRGSDGKLYIESSEGNFRIEGMKAVPVEQVAEEDDSPQTLPDGSSFRFVDASEHTCRILELNKPDGTSNTFNLDFEAAGTDIFSLHKGPDGCVYGSSILPERLFRYNPNDSELVDLGVCSVSTGEAYSFANLNGKVYIMSYPGARISIYDPSRPYQFGEDPDSNPRDIGRVDDVSYRPWSSLAGPGGKVWLASVPDYGLWGGPLSYYDPDTGEKKAYKRIVGDLSCFTLAHIESEGLLAVGTTTRAGSGTQLQQKSTQAIMILFDYEKEEKVWEGTVDRPVVAFNALAMGSDGLVYGTVTCGKDAPPQIFVFDPSAREFVKQVEVPEGRPVHNGLQFGPDGSFYGITQQCIYRLEPRSLNTEILARFEGLMRNHVSSGPILGNDLYFGSGHVLMAAKIS